MKLFALLALLPAILALPKPESQPEAYNPFLPPPIINSDSTLSSNPISHASLNSRAEIVAKAPHFDATLARRDLQHQNHHVQIRRVKSARKVKRQNASCVPREESTVVPSPSATASPSTTATTTDGSDGATQQPTTSPSATTTQGGTTQQPTTSPSPSPSPSPSSTTTSQAAPPQETRYTVDPDGNGPFVGQATYYDTDVGYGSCGKWHKNWEPTVALSRELMDNWPGYNGLNPNNNPICGQKLQLNYGGKSLIAEVQDTCPSCTKRWIDVSQGIFEYFAHTDVGMLGIDGYTPGFTWQWVDINTPLTVLPH